jgi:hypothetical protein
MAIVHGTSAVVRDNRERPLREITLREWVRYEWIDTTTFGQAERHFRWWSSSDSGNLGSGTKSHAPAGRRL